MKCEKCGKEFPSKYYFKVGAVCHKCYEDLDAEEKAFADERIRFAPGREKTSLASVLKGVLTLVYFIMILTAVVVFVGFISVMINPEMEKLNTFRHFSLLYKLSPIDVDRSLQIIYSNPAMSNPEIELLAAVNFTMGSRWFILIYFSSYFLFLGLAFVVVAQLRRFLGTLDTGNPFVQENAKRIRIIGWTMIISQVAGVVWTIGFAMYLKLVAVPKMSITLYGDLFRDLCKDAFWSIMAGLVVLTIAEIFNLGTQLREEQELTI